VVEDRKRCASFETELLEMFVRDHVETKGAKCVEEDGEEIFPENDWIGVVKKSVETEKIPGKGGSGSDGEENEDDYQKNDV